MKTNNKTLRYVALIVAALAVTCLGVAVFSRAIPSASAQTTRGTIVYSRAYDGFVNIRKKPSFSAEDNNSQLDDYPAFPLGRFFVFYIFVAIKHLCIETLA